jgi:hypothetical protein
MELGFAAIAKDNVFDDLVDAGSNSRQDELLAVELSKTEIENWYAMPTHHKSMAIKASREEIAQACARSSVVTAAKTYQKDRR